ncbi:hypothetical protein AB0M43_37770 [Longispora sp. NPDC051575]|uniref:hypothetical protein n=1 Tax=Longispora sp. NPDC051575 TaxID=3154943 RepID=UPI00342D7C5D
MNTTTRRAVVCAAIPLLLGLVAAYIVPRTDSDLHNQAATELVTLGLPPGTTPADDRPTEITRTIPAADLAGLPEVLARAHGQGWRTTNCGDQVCLGKGIYQLMIERKACTPPNPSDCGLAVTISWHRPLLAWRLLGTVVLLVVGSLAAFLLVARARARDTAGQTPL